MDEPADPSKEELEEIIEKISVLRAEHVSELAAIVSANPLDVRARALRLWITQLEKVVARATECVTRSETAAMH